MANKSYNQFEPQKEPHGDQKTNFIMSEYPDNPPDQMPIAKLQSVQTQDGWDLWNQVKHPM